MHSHERTLLANLGFQDPDKANSLHDLACQFTAEPAQSRRLVSLLVESQSEQNFFPTSAASPSKTITETRLGEVSARIEEPILRGERFKTTIGFLDVAISYTYERRHLPVSSTGRESSPLEEWRPRCPGRLLGEVKIAPVPMGDIVRQINLYRECVSPEWNQDAVRSTSWFLAVPYVLSEHDAATLRRERIRPIRLGDGFRRWVEETKVSGAARVPEF